MTESVTSRERRGSASGESNSSQNNGRARFPRLHLIVCRGPLFIVVLAVAVDIFSPVHLVVLADDVHAVTVRFFALTPTCVAHARRRPSTRGTLKVPVRRRRAREATVSSFVSANNTDRHFASFSRSGRPHHSVEERLSRWRRKHRRFARASVSETLDGDAGTHAARRPSVV